MTMPGFATSEFLSRTRKLQSRMEAVGIAALLLTTEADVRYVSGFLTRFWESPTRPWFMVLPAQGMPIAVIPSIGAALMQSTWVDDIRTWRAPNYTDDGISLLAETLCEVTHRGDRIGMPDGNGTYLRMPVRDLETLRMGMPHRVLTGDDSIMRDQRQIKSDAEIEKIATACGVGGRAFARVPQIARAGSPLSGVFRQFQILCLEEGADWVPYLAGGAGQGGYKDVISPATELPLATGDVMMLDTGLMHDGYFCDFDRNFSVGPPAADTVAAHARLIEATQAAFETAKPGRTAADLFEEMNKVVGGGTQGSDAGRLGHGLGMQLTEPPSLIPDDQTVLEPGMVLTLEPGIDIGQGRMLVHEENIVIREQGAVWLSEPSKPQIPVLC